MTERSKWYDAGMAAIRITTGAFMIFHGWQTFDREAMLGYVKWLGELHFPAPALLAYAGKIAELVGGLCLTVGLFTRVMVWPMIITMLVIVFGMGKGKIFEDDQHPFLFVLLGLVFYFAGGGKYSLDHRLKKAAVMILASMTLQTQAQDKPTYCNPLNLDYGYCPIPNFTTWGKHRATADPVIVNFKGDYYLFSTNQWGYWWSPDLANWNFVPRKFLKPWHKVYDELCAPAVGIIGDTMIVFGSTYSRNFPIWMSTNPKTDDWKEAIDSLDIGGWDPAFFTDDDGKLYMYNGSSNVYPLYGVELDRKTFQPKGTRKEMYFLEQWRYGWQRFGEYMDNTFLDPFIEGAWVTKHKGKYYLQYGAPGTEMSGYADGVVVSDNPLGPFQAQSDPLSFKPGGFIRGAGHGATFQDNYKNYWHVSTMNITVKNTFERRNGLWPAGFDNDGVMYCNTAFGDYPHYLPDGETDHLKSRFTGWMLLNYKKPVTVSSTYGQYAANNAVDESVKTYWSAASANKGEWIQSDLGEVSVINAIQINYADQDAEFLGKQTGIFHQYRLYASDDGKKWRIITDKSGNKKDVPHDYITFKDPLRARYIKLENIHMPTGKFAISGLRIFGKGNGQPPAGTKEFIVLRTEKDKRSALIKWQPDNQAYAYNIYYGTAPDKLYNCIMVHDANEYYFKGMDSQKTYYYTIESINENGISPRYKTIKAD